MSVLVLAEINEGALALDTVAKTIGAACALGEVTVLVAGEDVSAASQSASTINGVSKVLELNDAAYAHHLAEPMADLLKSLAEDYSHIVAPATVSAKNIMPRLSALLDVMIISDVMGIIDKTTFDRPIYAGNAIQTVQSNDKIKVLTIRATAFDAAGSQDAAPIEQIAAVSSAPLSEWVEDEFEQSDRPKLESAKTVIAGGRGLGSEENFELVTQLADKLGAAVGASRAAVDAGYVPNDWQVGQTGKIVAPDLYIAVGISGAIQHLAGMDKSKLIVAINKDPDAPIFQIADLGLAADLFEALPEMLKKL